MTLIGVSDVIVFMLFVISVIAIGLWKSKGEEIHSEHGAQDYFLAGRGLTWWLVGFSLIAANISTEQFVGMSGKAADWLGMAIASYEWMGAITMVIVAFLFLPKFLKAGIYTIPEFLEYRYNSFARTVMAISTMIIIVGVPTAMVIFSGAKVICVFFQGQTLLGLDLSNITVGCWIIGTLAAIYVFAGGLKACAWAGLLQGAALIVGGVIIAFFAMHAMGLADANQLAKSATTAIDPDRLRDMGAIARFKALNAGDWAIGKLHMVRPANDPEIPWTTLVFALWIPNFFYWGLNQHITQRTLGSKSLDHGQKGVVFAAFLKLLIPFIIVIPGILAFNLYSGDLQKQADIKNKSIIQQFHAGEEKLFEFTETFAKLNVGLTKEIYSHNSKLVHQNADSTILKNPRMLFDANCNLIRTAQVNNLKNSSEQKIKLSEKLIGYDYDAAFPTLLKGVLPVGFGILGLVLAAIFGGVVSSLAAMINSASTIATMDIYNKIKKKSSQYELVSAGRIFTILFVVISMFIAPHLDNPNFGGIFTFNQEFQGFITSGILAVFLFGLFVHRAPRFAGTIGLIMNPIVYGILKWGGKTGIGFMVTLANLSFLNRMAITFITIIVILTVITIWKPLQNPVELPVNEKMNLSVSKSTKVYGYGVIALTILLYIVFF